MCNTSNFKSSSNSLHAHEEITVHHDQLRTVKAALHALQSMQLQPCRRRVQTVLNLDYAMTIVSTVEAVSWITSNNLLKQIAGSG